jgi:integrase
MTNKLTTTTTAPTDLEIAGAVANGHAARAAGEDYRNRKSDATLRAQRADLATFAEFLTAAGLDADPDALQMDPQSWHGITWGIVAAFRQWALDSGRAIGTINRALSTIRTYAKLAAKAGAIDATELVLIRGVEGYSAKDAKRVNERRDVDRIGDKKAAPTKLTATAVPMLKDLAYYEGPQGARDCLLMCLLLDHGLRVSEVYDLRVKDFDLARRTMTFYRRKVNKVQTHKLTAGTLRAATAYLNVRPGRDALDGRLLLASKKTGDLLDRAMSIRAINSRVRHLAESIGGVQNVSPHDCRHYWATDAAANGSSGFSLRDAGGWTSMAMPSRYVAAAEIANEGIKLTF